MRTKICGITQVADAKSATLAGTDAIGLVFYAPSSRNIAHNLTLAREIALAVGPFVTVVGLFVDPTVADVESVLTQVPIQLLQFHGDETEGFCRQFKRPYIKAIRMKDDIDVLAQIEEYPSAVGILLDSYKKGVAGGTGESFNWERVPLNSKKPIVLAGGLTPENVGDAIRVAKPYAVDVSGGVELEPGKKCSKKIKAFVDNAVME